MAEFNAAAIRPTRLRRFGDTIYPGGGEELIRQMDDVKAGRRLEF